jgi:hypothetical protein
MFLIDDVLLAPGKAAFLLFQQLARKAQDEWLNDDTVKEELQQLYEMLESGRISDREFEERECRLLERLEQIARLSFQNKWGGAEPVAQAPADPALPAPEPFALPPPEPASAPPAVAWAPPPIVTPLPPPVPFALPPAPIASPPIAPPPIASSPIVTPPVAVAPPLPDVHVPAPAPVPASPGVVLSVGEVIDCAVRALAVLRMRVSTIASVVPEEGNWKVSVELVERRGIPDTNDVLGLYELWLDPAGRLLRYERTMMRRRCDFAR